MPLSEDNLPKVNVFAAHFDNGQLRNYGSGSVSFDEEYQQIRCDDNGVTFYCTHFMVIPENLGEITSLEYERDLKILRAYPQFNIGYVDKDSSPYESIKVTHNNYNYEFYWTSCTVNVYSTNSAINNDCFTFSKKPSLELVLSTIKAYLEND